MASASWRFVAAAAAIVCGSVAAQSAVPAHDTKQHELYSQLPLRRDDPPVMQGSGALQWLGVLAAGAAAVFYARRRWLGSARTRPVPSTTVVSTVRLTPHAYLHVIDWKGQQVLLGSTAQSVTVLARHSVHGEGEGDA